LRPILAACLAMGLIAQARAQTVKLAPALSGLAFLVGHWSSSNGKVADTGGSATGISTITAEAGGAVLLRRDHTNLFDASGKPMGGFDQIMMIYAEAGAIHADYFDGVHTIHYVAATVQPGRAVSFATAAAPGAPSFRLAYTLSSPKTLTIAFAMAPPGSTSFHLIATGTAQKGG
jgi:hypothetical protein